MKYKYHTPLTNLVFGSILIIFVILILPILKEKHEDTFIGFKSLIPITIVCLITLLSHLNSITKIILKKHMIILENDHMLLPPVFCFMKHKKNYFNEIEKIEKGGKNGRTIRIDITFKKLGRHLIYTTDKFVDKDIDNFYLKLEKLINQNK